MAELFSQNLNASNEENKENVTLIWFNSTIEITEDIKRTIEDFQTLNDFVSLFNDIDKCINYIKSIDKEKIFLIISGDNACKLLPNIIDYSQLDSIFIFPENRDNYSRLCDDFCKIVDIFNNIDELKVSIQDNIKHLNKQIELFSFYDFHQQSLRDISTQSGEFLWFQLFKDVITCLSGNDKAKEEMLDACRQYYRRNHHLLKMIEEFDNTYHADDSIRWYTRETFVYQLINKALRTEDIEQLYTFRFYIADLSNQLAQEHKKIKNQSEGIIYLYRGTIVTKEEVQTIKNNQGKLIATNSYWSTTRDRSYAITFAKKLNRRPNMIPVLFQIKCHLHEQNNSIVFADISNFSHFPEEKEVLFDLGAIFTIEQITEETTEDIHLLIINLKANGEGREIYQKYLEENRKAMKFESPTILLCNLLKRIGKHRKSFHFLEYLVKNPGNENLAHIHTRIGIAFKDEKKYQLALNHFDEALQLTMYSDSLQSKYLPFILHNKGLVYAKIKQYYQALQLYQQAQEILENDLDHDHYVMAHVYNSIGRVYLYQGYFNDALHYIFKALAIHEEFLPDGHVFSAPCYTDIANIYSRLGDYKQALKYHFQALDIRKKGFPANHYSIAWNLRDVGNIYHNRGHSQLALQFYLQSIQIYKQCQSTSWFDSVLHLLDDIISLCNDSFDLSLQYQLEALDIQKQIKPIPYFILASRLDTIAFTYKSINDLDHSLQYYNEALEIRKKYLRGNRHHLALSFHNLASVYDQMGERKNALAFYEKEMSIFKDIYPFNHWMCKRTRTNLERIKKSIQFNSTQN